MKLFNFQIIISYDNSDLNVLISINEVNYFLIFKIALGIDDQAGTTV